MPKLSGITRKKLKTLIDGLDKKIDYYKVHLETYRGGLTSVPTKDSPAHERIEFFTGISNYAHLCDIYLGERNALVEIFPDLGLEKRVDPFTEVFPEL